ncbi:hypothetical protein, partial [Vibrio metschnikovii]|uniref:hypothetical protein n=1 Tax=Vibrio metschnikovii TaxID=28172 RepID=UPI001C304F45
SDIGAITKRSENIFSTEPSLLHNAQLSSPKRYYQLSAQHHNHQTQRKTKMPRVEGLLELFVIFQFHTSTETPNNL